MKELKELFSEIEGTEFATYINILSGFRVFQQALESSPLVEALSEVLTENPTSTKLVLERFTTLIEDGGNPEFQHPHDQALAGYLYVLNKVDPELAHSAANKALPSEQLWWAKKLAQHILANTQPAAQ